MTAALIIVIVAVIGLAGAFVLTRLVSRRTDARTGEELAADAETEVEILDGDWGVAPPSEPSEPTQDD
jgi:hypothetical protein